MAGASQTDDFVSEINVTPFVDVMLVLLIIFMITAPMMTEGLNVDLPKVRESETLPTENDHLVLTVKEGGALFLDEYETTLDDLPHVLETNVRTPGRQLFVRADRNVPYGTVMEVMGRIRGAGISDVGLVTVSAPEKAADSADEGGDAGRDMKNADLLSLPSASPASQRKTPAAYRSAGS